MVSISWRGFQVTWGISISVCFTARSGVGKPSPIRWNFSAHTQALIIDVRQCLGGYPGMVALLCSYLFGDDPIHLASIYWRDEDITQEYWTEASLHGPRYTEKAVYVLTSKATSRPGR